MKDIVETTEQKLWTGKKTFTIHIFDKAVVANIHRELFQLNKIANNLNG